MSDRALTLASLVRILGNLEQKTDRLGDGMLEVNRKISRLQAEVAGLAENLAELHPFPTDDELEEPVVEDWSETQIIRDRDEHYSIVLEALEIGRDRTRFNPLFVNREK
jgi:hypothetical protein